MTTATTAVEHPFPGLRPFEGNESHLFFGREGQTDELLGRLGRSHFVAVVGSSGSGKSSLVRAGLLPALYGGFLTETGSRWRIALFRPSGDALGNMARALGAPKVLGGGRSHDADQVLTVETTLRRSSLGLIRATQQARLPTGVNLLLVVDQFEELFRMQSRADEQGREDAAAFVKLLLEAGHQRSVPIYVLLTMRSDFLGRCSQFQGLPEALNDNQYLIPRMTRDQLRRAITGPVAVGGGEIAPRLVQRLLNDVGDDQDRLPVLQHALMRTWESAKKMHPEQPLDLEDYEAIGGMSDALSQHADEAYNELPDERSRVTIAPRLFQAVTEKTPDQPDSRHPLRLEEICAISESEQDELARVIDCFRAEGRAFLMPPHNETLRPDSVIDISHESLIRQWTRLRQWVAEEAESRTMYVRIVDDARLFEQKKGSLWRDPELQLALDWWERKEPNCAWGRRYSPGVADAHSCFESAQAFLETSRQVRDEEANREKAQRRKKMIMFYAFLVGVTVVALVFLFVIAWGLWERKQMLEEQERALVRELAGESLLEQTEYPALLESSVLYAAESAKRDLTLENVHALQQGLYLLPKRVSLLKHEGRVWAVCYSPDGRYLATASDDKTARVFEISGKLVQQLKHTGAVWAVTFSADGKYLATGSADAARLFDTRNWKEVLRFSEPVDSVSFSPDSRHLVFGSFYGAAVLFDATSGKQLSRLPYEQVVRAVAFSADGRYVAAGGDDTTAGVFETKDGGKVWHHKVGGAVRAVAFSPDGRHVATGTDDSMARLFDAQSGKEVLGLPHKGAVRALAFTSDGRYVATGCDDGAARIFETKSGREVSKRVHKGAVYAVAFSPDGRHVATGSDDSTARIFEAADGREVFRYGHEGPVLAVAFSPDGRYLATGSVDATAAVFEAVNRYEIARLPVPAEETVDQIALSPEGRYLATISKSGRAHVFDLASGKPVGAPFRGFEKSAALSREGHYLAVGGESGVAVFETASGKSLPLPNDVPEVDSVSLSPDGRYVVTGGPDETVQVFETSTGNEAWHAELQGNVTAVAFSPDGQYVAAAGEEPKVNVFRAATGQALPGLPHAFLAETCRPPLHGCEVRAVAFSKDGRYIVTASNDKTARAFDVSGAKEVARFIHLGAVSNAVFSHDERFVATASNDLMGRVFEVASRKEVWHMPLHRDDIFPLQFTGNDKYVLSASPVTGLLVERHPWRRQDLLDDACSRLTRNLTPEEWKQYSADEPPKTCGNLP